ncbi:protein TWIN LOV 1-like [Nicotiana tomentosiformis]|uniref:protein TWIN LOV 1-like n=1 Tax=Nicotiana tomentosiformis TaxID=4098 RepID=UPI00051B4BD9|nr:protein TWIN LOV 1-like isoform X1 [Nicotiana tomentosiformis]XP_009613044.1 protein TWIN LOV 1-like isoform X1 [Nicotiana tomentosiformis]
MESEKGMIEHSFDCYSAGFQESLDDLSDNFTITDPYISGNPIVYASKGFLEMFGYSKYEVIGRNGRIFQGPKTNRRSVMEIREAIREERTIQISLLNYRKDGTPFWMLFHMCPVFGEKDGRLIHFLGVQVPILRRAKQSRVGIMENGVNLCQDGAVCRESVLRCYRKEDYYNSIMKFERELSLASGSGSDLTGVDAEGPCDASDLEKRKASASVNSIQTVLTHYSESTCRPVHGNQCSPSGMGLLRASLNRSLGRIKQSFVLTDANLPDMPIVYASDSFLNLTGFSRDEVLGHTYASTQFRIKECIQNEQPCNLRMLNYRKDGTSFWLHISPVRNASGKVAYLVAVESEDNSETKEKKGLRQHGVVAAVKVAVRGFSMGVSTC